jgi:hypothetical protein
VIVTRLDTPEALGYAEAARIVGQPIFVLAVGLSALLNTSRDGGWRRP